MKIIKGLLLLPIFVSTLTFTTKNSSIISLTGFEVGYSDDGNYIRLPVRISVPYDVTSFECYFKWVLYKDDETKVIDQIRLTRFSKCENKYLDFIPLVNINKLGKENYFEIQISPSDLSGEKITKKLYFNNVGTTQVQVKEKDNDIGVTSGYHIESYSPYDKSKDYVLEDRLTFSNFEDLVIEERYLNFDISKFHFTYTGNKEKSTLEGEFAFAFYDKYNLFTDFPLYKESQYRYIPLKIDTLDENYSTFSFKNDIYYDPTTHNPSYEYKENYVETNKLYFPLDQVDKLKEIHCLLSLDVNGYTNFNITGEFDVRFLKKYFGDCSDSEYCMESQSDEGENIREKVVDVEL